MVTAAFDNDKYLQMQSEHIRQRIAQFGGKLYLEFGGKLYDDNHASRVLPGFQPDSKLRMLLQLKDQVEMVIAINADDIEKNKVRGDLGITYDRDVIRLIDVFRGFGLYVSSVVLTRYHEQSLAKAFQSRLPQGWGFFMVRVSPTWISMAVQPPYFFSSSQYRRAACSVLLSPYS